MGGLGTLLEACGTSTTTTGGAGSATKAIPLPRPNNPVTWPIYAGNHSIASGMQPERDATLQIFNWVAYVNPQTLKDFGKKYGCKVQVTTFNTMSEAMSKLRSGQVNFDVFMGVTVDVMGQLVEQAHPAAEPHLPAEHLPGVAGLHQPVLRPGSWQYTVPYTIYTTGIAWRKDHVHEDPYKMSQPVGHAVAGQVQGQGRDPRRLPRGHFPPCQSPCDPALIVVSNS